MTRASRMFIPIGALLLVCAVSAGGGGPRAQSSSAGQLAASSDGKAAGVLDGMTFRASMGPSGKPADVEDNLIFAEGMFLSMECDRRCGYPPAPYYVRHLGERIEFVSESTCDKYDATMSWRGTIEDGVIKGRVRWTAERWYWTIKKEFWFEGTLADDARPVVVNE